MNVTLIGMAGAGKSFIGKRLAKQLGLEFLDIDHDCIQEIYKKPIQQVLDELGEEKYVDMEGRLIIDRTKGREDILISPGGSIIYHPEAMEHVSNISAVVYLRVPFETINKRLENAPPRAIIGLGKKTMRELYHERVPLYEKYADFTIDSEKQPADDIVKAIVAFLKAGK